MQIWIWDGFVLKKKMDPGHEHFFKIYLIVADPDSFHFDVDPDPESILKKKWIQVMNISL